MTASALQVTTRVYTSCEVFLPLFRAAFLAQVHKVGRPQISLCASAFNVWMCVGLCQSGTCYKAIKIISHHQKRHINASPKCHVLLVSSDSEMGQDTTQPGALPNWYNTMA